MRPARHQQSGIGGRQRIHILGGIQRVQHLRFVEMLGQWQLHQDAMHALVGRQFPHLGEQGFLCRVGGKRHMRGLEAQRFGGLALVADIDFGGRIVSHQHGGKARLQSMRGFQSCRFGGDFFA